MPRLLRQRAAPFVFTSLASIVVPFLLGCGLAVFIQQSFGTPGVRLTAFALFMGVAMSITAFPVLARILTDRGLSKTELGVVALTCAAVNDVTAWCLLAVAVGAARAAVSEAMATTLLVIAFILFMFFVAGPVAARLANRHEESDHPQQDAIAWTLIGMLVSAVIAEMIGIHAIFGAFLFGRDPSARQSDRPAAGVAPHARGHAAVPARLLRAHGAEDGNRAVVGVRVTGPSACWSSCWPRQESLAGRWRRRGWPE